MSEDLSEYEAAFREYEQTKPQGVLPGKRINADLNISGPQGAIGGVLLDSNNTGPFTATFIVGETKQVATVCKIDGGPFQKVTPGEHTWSAQKSIIVLYKEPLKNGVAILWGYA